MQDWPAWVVRAQGGDLAAFERVVRRFEDMAVGYAYSVLGDFQLAEDAAQEAFIQAYLDLGTLQEPRALPAWLRRIVFKQCDRFCRRKRPPTVPLDALELADQGQTPLEAMQRREIQDTVLEAVNALPEHERIATTLFYIDGYSMAEVGDFLEVPVSTVKNRLHAARRRLQERMVGQVEETLKRHAPSDDFGRRVRNVLAGIERIHWETTSCICFVGAAVASMHYLGEDVSNEYVMGISGGAFKMLWFPGWSPALCDLLIIGEEPIRRTFAALGYEYAFLPAYGRPDAGQVRASFRQKIVESIDRGLPAIALGIVGPPEACVVSGYDKGGAVLYGRSYFQEHPNDYFRAEDWEKHCHGLILIGEKKGKPSPRQVLRDALEWAIELARVPQRECAGVGPEYSGLHFSGLAAYDAMADALLRDEEFPAGDLEALTERCVPIANDGVCLMAGKRWFAAEFLKGMAAAGGPCGDELRSAAALYLREAQVFEQAARAAPRWDAPEAERLALAERSGREKIARLVREAKGLEEQAVEHLERAYQVLTSEGA